MSEIRFVDTTVRDGSQSLWAIGMRTDMILPIAQRLDDAGFDAIEIMATSFEKKLIRDLHEDPWERLVEVRKRVTRTPLRRPTSRATASAVSASVPMAPVGPCCSVEPRGTITPLPCSR
jgi:pyruvate carboxylase